MNAAFLLVTSAMLVGQAGGDKKPAPAPVAPAPVVSTGCGSSCGGCQEACGCDTFGHRLREKLRGLFARKSCDTCETCKPAPTCHTHAPLFTKSCDTCDSCPKVWTWQKRCHEPACTSCAPKTCDTCNSCGSHAFLEKLREAFRRKDCCETCSTCGSSAPAVAPPAPVKSGEKIEAPKKMPEPPKTPDKKPAQVRIETAPAPIPAITTPTVEVAPAPSAIVPVPRVEGDSRSPF